MAANIVSVIVAFIALIVATFQYASWSQELISPSLASSGTVDNPRDALRLLLTSLKHLLRPPRGVRFR